MDTSPIVIDIETCGLDNAADWLEPVQPDSRLKDPEKVKADIEAKTEARLEKLGLDWNVGRIVAMGWWTDTAEDYVPIRNEEYERVALESFWRVSKHRTIVGFNVKAFDLRYMVQRSRYLGVPYPDLDLGKYSHRGITDLYSLLTFNEGVYDNGAMKRTLPAFAKRFGIPVTDTIKGKDIPSLVAAGDWESVVAHVQADVQTTVELARRLRVIQPQPELVQF